jgi:hypothetical protein
MDTSKERTTPADNITAQWLLQQTTEAKLAALILLGWASSDYGEGLATEILTRFWQECRDAAQDEQAPINLETRTMFGVWLEQNQWFEHEQGRRHPPSIAGRQEGEPHEE